MDKHEDEKKTYNLINIEAERIGETVRDIYTDGLQPAVRATGNLLSLLPRWLRLKLWPYEKQIANQEYECKHFYQTLEKKLEGKAVETPERYVAVPLLEAVSYSYDCAELHELYATLLANAMLPETKNSAHPAFVDIIRHLSPVEAKLIKETNILIEPNPICSIIIASENKIGNKDSLQNTFISGTIKINNFTLFAQLAGIKLEQASALIENLIRLGLVERPETLSLTNENAHDSFKHSQVFAELQENFLKYSKDPENRLYLVKAFLHPTEFGKLFYEMCVK